MENEARLHYIMDTRTGRSTGLSEMMTTEQARLRNNELARNNEPFIHTLASCIECDSCNGVTLTQAGALCGPCNRAYASDIRRFDARLAKTEWMNGRT